MVGANEVLENVGGYVLFKKGFSSGGHGWAWVAEGGSKTVGTPHHDATQEQKPNGYGVMVLTPNVD